VWHREASFLANLWQLGGGPLTRPNQQASAFPADRPLDDEAGELPDRAT
jgi:hypothetical protein